MGLFSHSAQRGLSKPIHVTAAATALCSPTAFAIVDAYELSTSISIPAQPSEAPPAEGESAAASIDASGPKLECTIAPYIWLTSFTGDLTIRGINFDVDASFFDIVDNTETVLGLMGAVDLVYDKWVFQFSGAWTTAEVERTRSLNPNLNVSGDLRVDTTWLELFGGYRFIDQPMSDKPEDHRRWRLDGFVGGRLSIIDAEASISSNVFVTLPDGSTIEAGRTRRRDMSESWLEPFLGARFGADLSEHWRTEIRGDVGGFGIDGSDFSWQAAAVIGYRWDFSNWSLTAFGGYRALSQDFSDGGFGWDMIVHGPIIGVGFSF